MKIRLALALALALIANSGHADEGESGTQNTTDPRAGEGSTNIFESEDASSDPNAVYIRWGETVEVVRNNNTIENVNKESGETTVHGTIGTISYHGGAVTLVPAGKPALNCPPSGTADTYGPCVLQTP